MKNKGFSLVEVLIILAIMSIIAGIAIPNLIGTMKKSRMTEDVSNASIIAEKVVRLLSSKEEYYGTIVETIDIKNINGTAANAGFATDLVSGLGGDIPSIKTNPDHNFFIVITQNGNGAGIVKIYAGNGSPTVELWPTADSSYAN